MPAPEMPGTPCWSTWSWKIPSTKKRMAPENLEVLRSLRGCRCIQQYLSGLAIDKSAVRVRVAELLSSQEIEHDIWRTLRWVNAQHDVGRFLLKRAGYGESPKLMWHSGIVSCPVQCRLEKYLKAVVIPSSARAVLPTRLSLVQRPLALALENQCHDLDLTHQCQSTMVFGHWCHPTSKPSRILEIFRRISRLYLNIICLPSFPIKCLKLYPNHSFNLVCCSDKLCYQCDLLSSAVGICLRCLAWLLHRNRTTIASHIIFQSGRIEW